MPLASWFSLQWYGPGAGAMATAAGAATELLQIKGAASANIVVEGAASSLLLDATRLVDSPLIVAGTGSLVAASPKGRARVGLLVRVNELSQDDVTGAVLETEIEPGLTMREALRLMTAALAGKVSGAATTTIVIRDVNDTTDRIVATVDSSGNRSSITLNTDV